MAAERMRGAAGPWRALLAAAPVRLWAMIGAGPGLTAFAAALVWIVWRGPWPAGLAAQQLTILGWALWIVLAVIAVIIVALASARVKAAGPGGASLEIDGGEEPAAAPQDPAPTGPTSKGANP